MTAGADNVRVVQLQNGTGRRVALVEEPYLRFLDGVDSVHQLATLAMAGGEPLSRLVGRLARGAVVDYDPIYQGLGSWRLLPAIDHPGDPARCLVSGTGLTHFGSAQDRHRMHDGSAAAELTDSLKMFQAGVQGGRPAPGAVGVAPEWFYKGVGTTLRGHGDDLVVPRFAEDGGEEAEIAGVYVIAADGTPCRVGLVTGNEFSDHAFEKRNYLNLAGSKLRPCAIGPELVLGASFERIPGQVAIDRGGERIWERTVASGEAEMSHSLRNLEHHHFKFDGHRRPGDVHVHFFGAHSLSYGEGLTLRDGDVVSIRFDGFGRALRNTVRMGHGIDRLIHVRPLG